MKALDGTDADWLGNALGVTESDDPGELLVGRVAVLVANSGVESETDWLFEAIVETELN